MKLVHLFYTCHHHQWILFGTEDEDEFSHWHSGLMLLFSNKQHVSQCRHQDCYLPSPFAFTSSCLNSFHVVFRKTTGGVAGHCWSDSEGNRPGYVQMRGVWWQGHREVVQRWSGGPAERTHQNDSHWKVWGFMTRFRSVCVRYVITQDPDMSKANVFPSLHLPYCLF